MDLAIRLFLAVMHRARSDPHQQGLSDIYDVGERVVQNVPVSGLQMPEHKIYRMEILSLQAKEMKVFYEANNAKY
ncbi:hypothetical protein DY251_10980 [Mesorhizobium denitrificans]|uniref:Uncharacterized protein n=1 Tax=Mesorhizobium denitrificans TaxID=2294114 RepID=A0A371XE99_9HYPH|nr:hypothetical protein DY251_10980 [Mesorhizobium denitrificans]